MNIHALIIDDNSMNTLVLSSLLLKLGVDSTTLFNPLDLEHVLITIQSLDLVFVDLQMPERSGYDVFDVFKADNRFNTVPLIVCTVYSDEIQSAKNYGFHSFLPKPIDSEHFPKQVQRILKGEHIWERI